MDNESDSESSGDSELSEGAFVARDRLAPKTQADYASAIHGLKQFAFDNREQYSDCISGDNIVLPVPLILGKGYLSHLRDMLVAWPHDPRQGDERTCGGSVKRDAQV